MVAAARALPTVAINITDVERGMKPSMRNLKMFESHKQPTPPATDVIAAPIGYSVLPFLPAPGSKPHMVALQELLPPQTYPVVGFRLHDGRADPISIVESSAGAVRYLLVGTAGPVYALDEPNCPCWTDREQWHHDVLAKWSADRSVKEPPTPPSGPVQLREGQGLMIFRH